MTLDDIKNAIQKAETIAILVHESPDGDALGSATAMNLALKQLGKNPDVIIPEFSRTFNFLPSADEIKKETDVESYDLTITLDCGDQKRVSNCAKYFEDAQTTISIDHHNMNPMFADINYVDHTSPACCQILIIIFEYLGIKITKDIGTCLLTGIITDTGGFKYEGVSEVTFEFAAELLRCGVNVSNIYKQAMQIKSKANFELRKFAMDRMQFLEEGKIAFTYITTEDEQKVGAEEGDHEGIVNLGRDIEGVEVSIFLHQAEDGAYKVSLRSNNYLNVDDVCLMFGGGGHQRAAGCKISGEPEEIKSKIINEIKKSLK